MYLRVTLYKAVVATVGEDEGSNDTLLLLYDKFISGAFTQMWKILQIPCKKNYLLIGISQDLRRNSRYMLVCFLGGSCSRCILIHADRESVCPKQGFGYCCGGQRPIN